MLMVVSADGNEEGNFFTGQIGGSGVFWSG